jgi:hypothetical protein
MTIAGLHHHPIASGIENLDLSSLVYLHCKEYLICAQFW